MGCFSCNLTVSGKCFSWATFARVKKRPAYSELGATDKFLLLSRQLDEASAAETIDLGLNPGRVKPQATKIARHRFLPRHSAFKGKLQATGGQVAD